MKKTHDWWECTCDDRKALAYCATRSQAANIAAKHFAVSEARVSVTGPRNGAQP